MSNVAKKKRNLNLIIFYIILIINIVYIYYFIFLLFVGNILISIIHDNNLQKFATPLPVIYFKQMVVKSNLHRFDLIQYRLPSYFGKS